MLKTTIESSSDVIPNISYTEEVLESAVAPINKYFVNRTTEWSDTYESQLALTVKKLSSLLKSSSTPSSFIG